MSISCGRGCVGTPTPTPAVADVVVVLAQPREVKGGLLAWASITIAPLLRLDGLALRITLKDQLIVTWPSRRASDGRRYPIIEPLDQALIRSVEAAVIAKYLAVRGERHITNGGRPG